MLASVTSSVHMSKIHRNIFVQVFVKGRFVGGCNDAPFAGGGAVPQIYNGNLHWMRRNLDFPADGSVQYGGQWIKEVETDEDGNPIHPPLYS